MDEPRAAGWPAHLALNRAPAGRDPTATLGEAEVEVAFGHQAALEDVCSDLEAVRCAGGVVVLHTSALALSVAHLVVHGSQSLASAIALVESHLSSSEASWTTPLSEPFVWLKQTQLCKLLQLEMRVRGTPSDLSLIPDCPKGWYWVHWSDGGANSTMVGRGRVIGVTRLRPDPRMARLHGFFSAAEADHIIQLARSSLHRSRVVDHSGNGGEAQLTDARTSHSCKVATNSDVIVQRAVQRAAYLCGLTPQHAEAVQMVHYLPGQEYRPHFDWFSPRDVRFPEKTRETGNRLISFFIYLSGCEAGGRTSFPRLQYSATPERGSGLMWYNLDRNGIPDERTLHAGCPVEKGEKWGLNIWMRERPKRPSPPRVKLTLSISFPPCMKEARMQSSVWSPSGGWVEQKSSPVTAATALDAESCQHSVHVSMSVRKPLHLPARCAGCGDVDTPVGLCLCRQRYVVTKDGTTELSNLPRKAARG